MDNWLKKIKSLHEVATVANFASLVGRSRQVINDKVRDNTFKKGDSLLNWLHQYIKKLTDAAAERCSGSNDLLSARVDELETKTAINRLAYLDKLENLVPVQMAADTLKNWSDFAAKEIILSADQITGYIEKEHNIKIEPEMKNKIINSAADRIKKYAKKLGDSL